MKITKIGSLQYCKKCGYPIDPSKTHLGGFEWCKCNVDKAQKLVNVDQRVMRFAKPIINDDDFVKWLNNRMFNAECENVNLDKHLLENYLCIVEQFINSPESKATKSVFEIATQTIKKYLKQNV